MPRDDAYETQPHNIDAEQALLGAILVDNAAYDRVAPFLEPEHFFDAVHGRIYSACGKFCAQGRKVTPVTLKNFFDNDGALAEIGGSQYLARLAGAATTIINAEEYAHTIHDLALRRDMIRIADELRERAMNSGIDDLPSTMIEHADGQLMEVLQGGASVNTTLLTAGDAARIAADKAAEAYKNEGNIEAIGLSSGMPSLDAKLGPMEGGAQIVVAGATSMGKTALAEEIAFQAGLRGKRGLIYSQEMKAYQLTRRWISRLSKVDGNRIRMGRFSEAEYQLIDAAARRIADEVKILIDEARNTNARQIAARARAVKRHGGLDFIVVDYLQLLAPLDSRIGYVQQVAQTSKALRDLAGDLDVPMILISQLNREFHKRENKRPVMSDLRDSGAIEQDADGIVFVHREQYYLEKAVPEENTPEYLKWEDQMQKWQGKAELIIPKLREGAPGGTAIVGFNGPLTQFHELEVEDNGGPVEQEGFGL